MRRTRRTLFTRIAPGALALALGALAGCEGGDALRDLSPRTVEAPGPRVVWDLGHQPLPEIPLPNDIATSPDVDSPTGLRLNASLLVPTQFEHRTRQQFDELDGWGTFMPLTIPFDADLDLGDLTARMRHDDSRFTDDAVYLVDLATGIPVPLDVGDGNFVQTLQHPDNYYANDPRAGQRSLILETVDEDVNHNGRMDPGEDTNFDGVLNRAAVFPAGGNAADSLTTFWEPDTHTLILRPLLPLRERSRYAVVVTSRLHGAGGASVRSPFETVSHPTQSDALRALDAQLRARPDYYGRLAYSPRASDPPATDRVVFAFAFTTQTTTTDLLALRRGLHGEGPFRALAATQPALQLFRTNLGASCTDAQRTRPFVVRGEALQTFIGFLFEVLGVDGAARDRMAELYRYVDYMAFGSYTTPYLMGDPASTDLFDHWQINEHTGDLGHPQTQQVPFVLIVPRALGAARPPFPLAVFGHGYGGEWTSSLRVAGNLASQGVATLGISGPSSGLPLTAADRSRFTTFFRGSCLGGIGQMLATTRVRDLNLDGIPDPAGDLWTTYVFHTRDNLRQLILDDMQVIRAFRGFDGHALAGADYNGDGDANNDLLGDFNGDGAVDVGGPDGRIYAFGESLGGITSMILGAAEDDVRATVPISGAGGLSDVAVRSTRGEVVNSVILQMIGPLIVSEPASAHPPEVGPDEATCSNLLLPDFLREQCRARGATRTSCGAMQNTLRFLVPDVADLGQLEIACLDSSRAATGSDAAPAVRDGDDVVVTNSATHERRCTRAGAEGRFRLAVPTDRGDPLVLTIYRGAGVRDYGACEVLDEAVSRSTIATFRVGEGDCSYQCGHIPQANYNNAAQYPRVARDTTLRSPSAGLALSRQTPGLRRFLSLAQAGLEAADPINYAPLYLLRRPAGAAQHALLNITTIGDQGVPTNTGNAFSRAAGLIPFFRADAPPEYADYAAPPSIVALHGNRTPNRLLIDRNVLEGVADLNRWPSARAPNLLFDVDNLDDDSAGFGELTETPPLRLVRLARPVASGSVSDLEAAWNPGADAGPLGAVINYYLNPAGQHSVDEPPRPTLPFDYTTYAYNLIARFFATDGRELYYRSNPATNLCLARQDCAWFAPRPTE